MQPIIYDTGCPPENMQGHRLFLCHLVRRIILAIAALIRALVLRVPLALRLLLLKLFFGLALELNRRI